MKDEKNTSDKREYAINFISGSLARMTSALIMCPADTIKTRIQFQGNLANVKKYNGFRHAFKTIYREEGLLGFTRGLPARLLYVAPSAGVSFFFYETIVKSLRHTKKDEDSHRFATTVLSFVGLSMARVFGSVIRTPFDVIKQRMQVEGSIHSKNYKNSFDASIKIIKNEGLRGMFNFAHAAVARDAPFALIYFSTYEIMKDIQKKFLPSHFNDKTHKLGIINHLLGGAVAGAVASTMTHPIDVIKTRLQTQNSLPKEQWRYTGIIHSFVKILKDEGVRGFYAGLLPRLLYITPSAAVVWASYEQYKIILHRVL